MRRSLLGVAVLTALLPMAVACGETTTTGTGTTSASQAQQGAGSGDDTVEWVDKVCGEIVKMVDAQTASPPDLQGSDPVSTLQAFDEYIGKNIDSVEQAITGLKAIGTSPIEGGDAALAGLVSGLEGLQKSYQATRDQFKAIDVNDPASAQTAIMQALSSLGEGGEQFGKAVEDVGESPALEAAGDKAPNCQKLDSAAGGTPTPTS